jgi:microcystin-dependent protein
MAEPFLGEIRTFAFAKVPVGWAQCNGQSMPVAQNQALYALLTNLYGGNTVNFNLPDLRGRAPINYGRENGMIHQVGEAGGTETVVLTTASTPLHTHQFCAEKEPANKPLPGGNVLATVIPTTSQAGTGANNIYAPAGNPMTPLNANIIGVAGGNAPHNNMQPSLVLNMCIATTGFFPTR